MKYVLILVLTNGAQVGLYPPYESEQQCMVDLGLVQAGVYREVTLEEGNKQVAVRGGVGCMPEPEYARIIARQAARKGAV